MAEKRRRRRGKTSRRLSNQHRADVYAALDLDIPIDDIVTMVGVSRRTVYRYRADWMKANGVIEVSADALDVAGPSVFVDTHSEVSPAEQVRDAHDPEKQAERRERAIAESRSRWDTAINLALDRIDEALQPGADPHREQMRVALWVIDKAVPSADAREGSKAAGIAADQYAAVIERITASDTELRERAQRIRAVQDDLVAQRSDYIVSPPDEVT